MLRVCQNQLRMATSEQLLENSLEIVVDPHKAFRKDPAHILRQGFDQLFQFPLGAGHIRHLCGQEGVPFGYLPVLLNGAHVHIAQCLNLSLDLCQGLLCLLQILQRLRQLLRLRTGQLIGFQQLHDETVVILLGCDLPLINPHRLSGTLFLGFVDSTHSLPQLIDVLLLAVMLPLEPGDLLSACFRFCLHPGQGFLAVGNRLLLLCDQSLRFFQHCM